MAKTVSCANDSRPGIMPLLGRLLRVRVPGSDLSSTSLVFTKQW